MSDVAQKISRLRQLRKAALVAVVIPAALVGACVAEPPPPPPPAPVAAPMPPPPPPHPVPVVRG